VWGILERHGKGKYITTWTISMKKKGSIWDVGYKQTTKLVIDEAVRRKVA
jgi:hypothetical protein